MPLRFLTGFLKRFQTLRWKLTFSAAVVMITPCLVMTIFVVLYNYSRGYSLIHNDNALLALKAEARAMAQDLHPLLAKHEPDIPGIDHWLAVTGNRRWLAFTRRTFDLGMVAGMTNDPDMVASVLVELAEMRVADPEGRIIASLSSRNHPTSGLLVDTVPASAKPLLRATRRGVVEPTAFAVRAHGDEAMLVAAPIRSPEGDALGLLYLEAATTPPSLLTLSWRAGRTLFEIIVNATPFVLLAALLLGWFSTRGLVGRLQRLGRVTDAWARGDFRSKVDDPSADEIGELGQRLDDMALRLSSLLDAREELAALEERNRLARELHDTVKQRVFSVSMLLGSVELLLESDRSRAGAHLADARQVAQEAGHELVALIDQLRPDQSRPAGFEADLRHHLESWSRAQGIRARVEVAAGLTLPEDVEQNLLRVTQEALANVGRHSHARQVEVSVQLRGDQAAEASPPKNGEDRPARIRLVIRDDGDGFDARETSGNGFGLESMASRMKHLGGHLSVESTPGHGTEIIAECPAVSQPKSAVDDDHDRAA